VGNRRLPAGSGEVVERRIGNGELRILYRFAHGRFRVATAAREHLRGDQLLRLGGGGLLFPSCGTVIQGED